MTHVITQPCRGPRCAACLAVCPVDCIGPTPAEPAWSRAPMLYIDPELCIDCGLCVSECPAKAIFPQHRLPSRWRMFMLINAMFFCLTKNRR
jgi:ferredoxin--NADP+ reductase